MDKEFYGLDVSASLISQIIEKIIDLAKEWHNRPLENIYPIVFFDAIHYKVTSEGMAINKTAYTCLSLNIDDRKYLLDL